MCYCLFIRKTSDFSYFAFFSWSVCAFRFFESAFGRAFSALYVCLSPKSAWEAGAEKNAKYFSPRSVKAWRHADVSKVTTETYQMLSMTLTDMLEVIQRLEIEFNKKKSKLNHAKIFKRNINRTWYIFSSSFQQLFVVQFWVYWISQFLRVVCIVQLLQCLLG